MEALLLLLLVAVVGRGVVVRSLEYEMKSPNALLMK